MIVYVLCFSSSIFISYLIDLCDNEIKSKYILDKNKYIPIVKYLLTTINFSILYCLAAIRTVGVDMSLYSIEFERINDKLGYVHSDFGFQILNRLIYSLGGSSFYLFALCSFIFLFGSFYLMMYFKGYLCLEMFLFIFSFNYLQSYSLIAQSNAIGFILISFRLLLEKKYIRSLIPLLIAFSQHSSSIIFALIYVSFIIIDKFKRKDIIYKSIIPIAIILSVIIQAIIPILLKGTRFFVYLSTDNSNLNSTSQIIFSLFILFIFILIIVDNNNIIFNDRICLFFFILQIFCTIFSLMQFTINLLVRLNMYLAIFQIYSLPYFLSKVKRKHIYNLLLLLVICIYLLWFIFFPFLGNYYNVNNYSSIFDVKFYPY